MKTQNCNIEDCLYITVDRYKDNRGFFEELYSERHDNDFNREWKQVNLSQSASRTLRGMHQAPYCKLVSCLQGEILDVVVDLRPNSRTFKQWAGFHLSEPHHQVFVPSGCAHGFLCYKDSMVMYLQNDVYGPRKESDWHYDSFGVVWPKFPESYILSEKDANAPHYK
jgi:dTDP-4-dehydrorhamnose 3,5-epimerase